MYGILTNVAEKTTLTFIALKLKRYETGVDNSSRI